MKNLLKWKPSNKVISFCLVAGLIISLIPIIRLCFNMVPYYDDYGYVKYTISFQEEYGRGLINAIRGAFFQARETWLCWEGTFATVFISSLSPLAWGEQYYFIGGLILITGTVVSSILMMYIVSTKVFGLKKDASVCISVAFSILIIQKMYFPGHGLFWFNGGVHYVGMHSLFFLLVSCLLGFSDKKGFLPALFQILISLPLSLAVGGGNYTTILQCGMILVFIVIYYLIMNKKYLYRLIPSILVFMVSSFVNITSPGNKCRAVYFEGVGLSPVDAVIKSFVEAIFRLKQFTDVFLIVLIILLAPIIWTGLEKTNKIFKFPVLFVFFSICIFAAGFTPNLYVGGVVDIARVLNACKMTFHLMIVLCEIYIIGWIKTKNNKISLSYGFWWVYFGGILVIASLILIGELPKYKNAQYDNYQQIPKYKYTSLAAFDDIHSGIVGVFHEEYLDRIETIKNTESGSDVLVKAYTFQPAYLIQKDLSEDPSNEANRFMAYYYHMNSIALEQ